MVILPGALGPTLARHLTYKKPFLVTVDKVIREVCIYCIWMSRARGLRIG
jgi:hypothetical protein